MYNNNSRNICRKISKEQGWKKEPHRNVVLIGEEKWSFSVSSFIAECRQTYSDTEGFITLMKDGTLKKYKVQNFENFTVSRISPSGVKAYNIVIRDNSQLLNY